MRVTYPSETESQSNISEWRKHISEPDARAELLLSKPHQVDELLDDLVFILVGSGPLLRMAGYESRLGLYGAVHIRAQIQRYAWQLAQRYVLHPPDLAMQPALRYVLRLLPYTEG